MYSSDSVNKIKEYIKSAWAECVRTNCENTGSIIGLPNSYVVPCKEGTFQEMHYWDTYFINQGLVRQGVEWLAKNNVDNLLYLADKFGYVPGGNRKWHLNHSQPPYLSMMVKQIFEIYNDKLWLSSACKILKKEYQFWMKNRITHTGLNRYGNCADKKEKLDSFYGAMDRLKIPGIEAKSEKEMMQTGSYYLTECESGWDFTPRFEGRCIDFNPIDLNSNLYIYEKNFAYFSEILKNGDKEVWEELAEKRKKLINELCWSHEEGIFLDYNHVYGRKSRSLSLASFHPLMAGLASPEQAEATVKKLEDFEYDYGLSACKKSPRATSFQWDHPNGWAPLHYIVIEALLNYGFTREALRIAEKLVKAAVRNFEETGGLWEKYNVEDGSLNVKNEYEIPPMIGWAAGAFIYASQLLEESDQLMSCPAEKTPSKYFAGKI